LVVILRVELLKMHAPRTAAIVLPFNLLKSVVDFDSRFYSNVMPRMIATTCCNCHPTAFCTCHHPEHEVRRVSLCCNFQVSYGKHVKQKQRG
jgi:hypothetical protein